MVSRTASETTMTPHSQDTEAQAASLPSQAEKQSNNLDLVSLTLRIPC